MISIEQQRDTLRRLFADNCARLIINSNNDNNAQDDSVTAEEIAGPNRKQVPLIFKKAVRYTAIVSLDAFATMFLLVGMLFAAQPVLATPALATNIFFIMTIVGTTVAVLIFAGLYKRSWRFLSFSDMIFLVSVISAAIIAAWAVCYAFFPEVRTSHRYLAMVAAAHWMALIVTLASMRVLRRALRMVRTRQATLKARGAKQVLLMGEMEWVRAFINLVHSDDSCDLEIVGILAIYPDELIGRISGVPVVGTPQMLGSVLDLMQQRGKKPSSIIVRDGDGGFDLRDFRKLVSLARNHNLDVHKFRDPWTQMSMPSPKINLEQMPMEELLGRPEFELERSFVRRGIAGKSVLVTGAGGSIGSELVRQIASFGPREIILLDSTEYNLYMIEMEMREAFPNIPFHAVLCSIRQRSSLRKIFEEHRPEIVFHAAALKHVPLVQKNACAGAHTNIIGTRNVADAVCEFGCRAMVLVSTDKAVNPVGTMGGTKRLSELYCQALDLCGEGDEHAPRFMTVRFGNVLGSSGSLIPLFKKQLAEGKPLTVTHPDIERFFMTIQEAVELILHSSTRALEEDSERGHTFVLDMGEPIKILDIARRVIRLAGFEPDVDVPIKFVGLRPGEKLFEELFDKSEERTEVSIPGVFGARPRAMPLAILSRAFDKLEHHILNGDSEAVCFMITDLIEQASNGFSNFMLPEIGGGFLFRKDIDPSATKPNGHAPASPQPDLPTTN